MTLRLLRLVAIAIPLSLLSLSSEAAEPAGLPPLETVRAAIAASPVMEAADAEAARARAAARRLRVGSYEFELSAGAAHRSIDADGDYAEWVGGVSRAVRWPDKRSADADLARLEVAVADAAYDAAWRDTALDWAVLWSEWRAAAALAQVAADAAADAEAMAAAEARRVDLGAGRAVERDRLAADAGLARIAAEQAARRMADAEAALAAAYPGFALPAAPPPLAAGPGPAAPDVEGDVPASPAVTAARLRLEQAQLTARRARMDMRPDPRLGLEVFSEHGGDETGLGVSVNFPLAGGARSAAADEAGARATAEAAQLRAAQQIAERLYRQTALRAQSARRSASAAQAAADAARTALDRVEQGRAMNALAVTELISARQAARAAQTARIEALGDLAAAELRLAILNGAILDPRQARQGRRPQ